MSDWSMDWARADMNPDDPGSQGYSPPPGYVETVKHIAARMEAAEAKLAAIRALHAQDPDRRGRSVCVECTRWLRANARPGSNATAVWPCPTAILVLEPKRSVNTNDPT